MLVLSIGCNSESPSDETNTTESQNGVTAPPQTTSSGVQTLVEGELQVCLYSNSGPISSQDAEGEWTGHDIIYLEDFAESLLLEFIPVKYESFEGIWSKPSEGECDVAASGISDSEERRSQSNSASWSKPYYDGSSESIGSESFSFVVRAEASALLVVLNHYIGAHPGFYGTEK
jgi:ABC-type amino acid transport substrate-binding protein